MLAIIKRFIRATKDSQTIVQGTAIVCKIQERQHEHEHLCIQELQLCIGLMLTDSASLFDVW